LPCWYNARMGRGRDIHGFQQKTVYVLAPAIQALAANDARKGRWDLAAQRLVLVARAGPISLATANQLALVHLKRGDMDAYRKLCKQFFATAEKTPTQASNGPLLTICTLAPDALPDMPRAVALVEGLVKRSAKPSSGLLNVLGMLYYRAGRYQDAIDRIQESAKAAAQLSVVTRNVRDPMFLAMAHHRLGDTAAAKKYWSLVVQSGQTPREENTFWTDLTVEILRREAESVLKSPPEAPKLKK
jgi:tetratricopeptide (TPR) repeat protein